MANCVSHSNNRRRKSQQEQQRVMRRKLRKLSKDLKFLKEQQCNLKQESRKLSTVLKRLEQKVQQDNERKSEEAHPQGDALKQVGKVLKEGMSIWINNVLLR